MHLQQQAEVPRDLSCESRN